MATPYLQSRLDRVASTQDVARSMLADLPVVVIASGQTEGRGRLGAVWETAPRALAVSMAFRPEAGDTRPFSLMAGVAAVRALDPGAGLKWPNDVMILGQKVGGILVETTSEVVVAGLGLNLWWEGPPEGAGAIYTEDPGPDAHAAIGGLWAAELMQMVDSATWPHDEYRSRCVTIGQEVTWDPEGKGVVLDVDDMGRLIVDVDGTRIELSSGVVNHVRS